MRDTAILQGTVLRWRHYATLPARSRHNAPCQKWHLREAGEVGNPVGHTAVGAVLFNPFNPNHCKILNPNPPAGGR